MAFTFTQAIATRENVIRVQFNKAIGFSQLFDASDGSDVSKYTVTAVAGGIGLDGVPVRTVNPVLIQKTDAATLALTDIADAFIDVVLDRPMSLFPCQYTLTLSALLKAADGDVLGAVVVPPVAALYRLIDQPSTDVATPSRDIANPWNHEAAMDDSLAAPNDPLNLGTFVFDETGDVAFDEGVVSVKKRILRRGMARPGGFAHLGLKYGVGIPQQGKKLAQASVLQHITGEYEKQILQEPEVSKAKVRMVLHPKYPGLVKLIILAKLHTGGGLRIDTSFSIGG